MARQTVQASKGFSDVWPAFVKEFESEQIGRAQFNAQNFETIADMRAGVLPEWKSDGMGLRRLQLGEPDFSITHEGDSAVKNVLPRGIFTGSLSEKMNGALRSPTLTKLRGKVSFEVIGGGFSLARIVFNNCQLNYAHQHSLHHPQWTWITVDCPEGLEALQPYIELLTYWDNPKFPDPLGTLSKDVENQRLPYEEHAKNPRTWWGVRRIVAHKEAMPPKTEVDYLAPLVLQPDVANREELIARYRTHTAACVEAFGKREMSDDQALWLDWCVHDGLLTNQVGATPRLQQLIEQYRSIEATRLLLPVTMPGVADETSGFNQPVLIRGVHDKPGEAVTRRFLEALDAQGNTLVSAGSGRAMLAERLASVDNPLTTRVIVNRMWLWMFGEGLVRTPDDFGHLGDLPSHPELLDYLAHRFTESDWSLKRLARSLALSRAFRGSSSPNFSSREMDPQNRLLSHYPARRAEAEVIRDSLLSTSGRLDTQMFGPSVPPYREKADTEKRLYAGPLDGHGRRSIYLKFQLMEAPRFLSVFNLPGGKVSQGRRDDSNVPAQSLALLNDPFVWAMAEQWAQRLTSDGSHSPETRIERMFIDALSRPPTPSELDRFSRASKSFAQLHNVDEASLLTSPEVWCEVAHTMFNVKEFITIP